MRDAFNFMPIFLYVLRAFNRTFTCWLFSFSTLFLVVIYFDVMGFV